MGDLSKNFSRHEFQCDNVVDCKDKNECRVVVDSELIKVMQEAADDIAEKLFSQGRIKTKRVTVHVTSGFRCPWWNGHEGGGQKSYHPNGQAGDFYIEELGKDQSELYAHLNQKYPDKYGIGFYGDRVHLDLRRIAERWKNI
jgi:uncharacterized protein YcbK (DUF882 family)